MSLDPVRYEELKRIVADYGTSGRLDAQYPIAQCTYDLLASAKKDAFQLLNTYCISANIAQYPFYGFMLTGRLDNNKFLCISEHEHNLIFGVPSCSKKEARSYCALRVLDHLLVENKLMGVLNSSGKKVRTKAEPPPTPKASAIEETDFTKDVDNADFIGFRSNHFFYGIGCQSEYPHYGMSYERLFVNCAFGYASLCRSYVPLPVANEFRRLNPVPKDCANMEEYTEVLERAIEYFNRGLLYEVQFSDEATRFMQVNPNSQQTINNTFAPNERPTFYTYNTSGAAVRQKFVTFAVFEGGVYYGALSPSKPGARSSCCAVVVDLLLQSGRIKLPAEKPPVAPVAGKKKTKAMKRANDGTSDGPSEKNTKLTDDYDPYASGAFWLTLLPDERLNLKTIFYIVSRQQNDHTIFNHWCQRMKKMPSPIECVSTNPFVIRQKFGEFTVTGASHVDKKVAKQSTTRAGLDALVICGQIDVPEPCNTLLEQPIPNVGKGDVFEAARRIATAAVQKAAVATPLISYCNPNLSAFFLLDVSSNRLTLVSWAMGKGLCSGPFSSFGSVVHDANSEVLARRGLLRFFYHQLALAKSGDEEKESKSVFSLNETTNKYRLRPNLSLHFYGSEAPGGDALAGLLPGAPRDTNAVVEHKPFNAIHPGKGALAVRVSATQDEPISNRTNDLTNASMSTSDKILKWNTVGVQGSLLNLLLEPVYVDSFAVARDYDAGNLSRAFATRNYAADIQPPFTLNRPHIQSLDEMESATSAVEYMDASLSSNWNAADNSVELISFQNGYCATGGLSRLCRRLMFRRFHQCASTDLIPVEYTDAKALNVEYSDAVRSLKASLENLGLGKWITKQAPADLKLRE